MLITAPIYVESRRGGEGEPTLYHARPLFSFAVQRADAELERALQKLTQDLRELLFKTGRGLRHEVLAGYAWNPTVQEHRIDLEIELKSRVARGRFLFVTMESLGRKLAFCPKLDAVWFEIGRGQSLPDRAQRVITEYFRDQERKAADESSIRPEDFALDGTAWVTTLELEIKAEQSIPNLDKELRALLGGQDVSDGATELSRCGRCLNWLSSQELSRAIGRDHEVSELERRLISSERRPVVLLGERLSGKTAIIHEYAMRATQRREHAASTRQNIWQLSPQRLIAGMSFVGQWESRLLAILRYARKKDLVLYFDDFLGLYLAGRSRDSSLNMATVLKPYLERRDCRFLAEMTPAAWRILREQDRGLADMFDVLPIAPATRDETAQLMMSIRRELEQQRRCRLQIDALTAVLDLQERFATDTAFPGKAIKALRDLAARRERGSIDRNQVLDAFHAGAGLTSQFFDPRHSIRREDIVMALQREVVGQETAIAAVADVLTLAKAQLNDPRRPLGSLLFVGPTGVGKTQLAKATARLVFGNVDRLIRFDLNQFVHAGAAARLIGTFAQPDGLLTSAVRQSTFAVILLDEIEKAHPEVFDLLLQVLGEGRLTDAWGRTVSFANTVIIMTSNLGVREAEQQLGFLQDAPLDDHIWHKAIERFFRPEFFNRIDRIVPFQRLSTETVRDVALLALDDVLQRDGLSRRQSFVVVEPRALDQLVEAGYSPIWGARGLKRTLEQQLVQPLARTLAGLSPKAVTRLQLFPAVQGIRVHVDELHEVMLSSGCLCEGASWHGLELIEEVKAWLSDLTTELEPFRPHGPISTSDLQPQHHAFFLLQERLRRVEHAASQLADRLRKNVPTSNRPLPQPLSAKKYLRHQDRTPAQDPWLRNAIADEQFRAMLDAMAPDTPSSESPEFFERQLLRQAALLNVERQALANGASDRAALFLHPQRRVRGSHFSKFLSLYRFALQLVVTDRDLEFGVDLLWEGPCHADGTFAFELQGLTASALAELETGLHLESLDRQGLRAWLVTGIPLQPGETVQQVWNTHLARRDAWLNKLPHEESLIDQDPWRCSQVVRLFEPDGTVLDFRTSLIEHTTERKTFLREALLDALPLPERLQLMET